VCAPWRTFYRKKRYWQGNSGAGLTVRYLLRHAPLMQSRGSSEVRRATRSIRLTEVELWEPAIGNKLPLPSGDKTRHRALLERLEEVNPFVVVRDADGVAGVQKGWSAYSERIFGPLDQTFRVF
jgi:hypothetical protein